MNKLLTDFCKPADVPGNVSASLMDIKVEEAEQPTESLSALTNNVIDVYTHAQAIEDGVLIDVTETAKEAGVVYPTAVTQALWDGYIVPPEELKGIQHLKGRLWDILTMYRFNAKAKKRAGADVVESQTDVAQTMLFKVLFQMPSKKGLPKMKNVNLKAVCGPGDTAEPVITIMLENEN